MPAPWRKKGRHEAKLRREKSRREAAKRLSPARSPKAKNQFGFTQEPIPCPCPCGGNAEPTTGAEIYEGRPDLADKRIYSCPRCGRRCGCHPESWEPLGVPASYRERKLRMQLHDVFDQIWNRAAGTKRAGRERDEAYKWLAQKLGLPLERTHVGMMSAETLTRAIAICTEALARRGS